MYQKAVEEVGGDKSKVDETRFRYVGPKPQSKETALVMLADTAEAMTKSKRPGSKEELEQVLARAIKIRVEQGQLDDSGLTLRDLEIIRQSFVDTLTGLYHSRLEYPEPSSADASAPDGVPTVGELSAVREKAELEGYSASFQQAFPNTQEQQQEAQEQSLSS